MLAPIDMHAERKPADFDLVIRLTEDGRWAVGDPCRADILGHAFSLFQDAVQRARAMAHNRHTVWVQHDGQWHQVVDAPPESGDPT